MTPKQGEQRPQPRAVAPTLAAIAILVGTGGLRAGARARPRRRSTTSPSPPARHRAVGRDLAGAAPGAGGATAATVAAGGAERAEEGKGRGVRRGDRDRCSGCSLAALAAACGESSSAPAPPRRGPDAAAAVPRPLCRSRRPGRAPRPGRRHGERGAGLRAAARRGDGRPSGASTRLALDARAPAARATACWPGTGRAGRSPTASPPPTPTSTRRGRCCWPRAGSAARSLRRAAAAHGGRGAAPRDRASARAPRGGPWARARARDQPQLLLAVAERALATLGHPRRWARVRRHGSRARGRLPTGGARLPPDWARAGPLRARRHSAPPPGDPGRVPRYGYDAVRRARPLRRVLRPRRPPAGRALVAAPARGDPAVLPRELGGRGAEGAVRRRSHSRARPPRPAPRATTLPATASSARPRPSTAGTRRTTARPGSRSAGRCSTRRCG